MTTARWDRMFRTYLTTRRSKGISEPEALALFVQANGPRPEEGAAP